MNRGKINKGVLSKYGFIAAMLAYPTVMFLIFYVTVNVNSVVMAFENINIDGTRTFIKFDNFIAFFEEFGKEDSIVVKSIVNSLKMWSINLVICMPLYIAFSYYLFKKWPGHSVIRVIIMLPSIISSFIVCLVFKKFVEVALPSIMKDMFGIDKFPNLITDSDYLFGTSLFYMIWVSFSTSLIVYSNAMKEIDDEIFEAAKMDGVGVFQELFYIILPLIFPTISTFLVLGVSGIFVNAGPIVAFYEYSAPAEAYNLGYYITQRTMRLGEVDYPKLAAIGIIITLVMAPVTFGVKALTDRLDPRSD